MPPFSLRFDGVDPRISLFLSLFLFLFCFIRKNEQNFPLSYKTCKFSHDFDLEMSVSPIFCRISLARCKERCVFEFLILLALCCAFFSRVSFRRIQKYYMCSLCVNNFFLFFHSTTMEHKSSIIIVIMHTHLFQYSHQQFIHVMLNTRRSFNELCIT